MECSCGLPRPIIKSHLKKSGCDSGLGKLPEIWGFPFNISATSKASDFNFGTQLGFAKAHHQIIPRGKSGGGLGLGELLKILGFSYNISAMAGASDFKCGKQQGFVEAHHKSTRRRKGGHGPGQGELCKIWGFSSIFTQWLKLATSNLVHILDMPRPIMKSYP